MTEVPMATEPETLEEWRDQALFQARLVAQLNRDCMRLRDALEWYAARAAGCRLIHSGGDADRAALDTDGGKRARKALDHG